MVHHRDAVGHRQRLVLVMGDDHEGDADALLQVHQLEAHPLAQLGVERRQRLVQQQHLRPLHQGPRSEEHTSELQSLMCISYAVFCLKKKNISTTHEYTHTSQENITT